MVRYMQRWRLLLFVVWAVALSVLSAPAQHNGARMSIQREDPAISVSPGERVERTLTTVSSPDLDRLLEQPKAFVESQNRSVAIGSDLPTGLVACCVARSGSIGGDTL